MTRIVVIKKDDCNPLKCGNLCKKLCPINRKGDECISIGEDKKASISEKLCVGCGICAHRCPTKCISVINLPEELNQPLHRFGKNSFALYNIPIPKREKVVGILGKNGIGKTTTIKILSGLIIPNLEKKASYSNIIEFFRGTELQTYFENLKNKQIKISYKPQKIDEIPKQYSGKVIDLLKKVNETNQLKEITKQLELDKILNNNIETLSGGELQRIAIAATALKKAEIYFFDEPASYLDIKQRLIIAKFIRTLANESTSIIVIEHDLIILDFITDLIHIMYGQPACYGIVSQIKTNKAGINTYLEGYLKEENIRFRSKPIKFIEKKKKKKSSSSILVEWPRMHEKLGNFKLNINPGSIDKEEIIGILGENAIGKTAFIKLLNEKLKIKISYKPQYLNNSSEEFTSTILSNLLKNSEIKNLILPPLELTPLLTKKINELSGGELQRVSIALALSKDCDLILLDEPSAYLDVEQRLAVSKVIRDVITFKKISALVVDHDLLFLDYLSNRLLVFSGIPASEGTSNGPFSMEQGMNILLKNLNITLRKDPISHRPRINKLGSVKDREQKSENKYYYS